MLGTGPKVFDACLVEKFLESKAANKIMIACEKYLSSGRKFILSVTKFNDNAEEQTCIFLKVKNKICLGEVTNRKLSHHRHGDSQANFPSPTPQVQTWVCQIQTE